MDLAQASKMIEWLDDERRQDKAVIARLEETIKNQNETIETLHRRLNGLESDLSSTKGQFLPASRYDEMITMFRTELQSAVERLDEKRSQAEREFERRNQAAREGLSRPMRDLQERLDKLEHRLDELPSARVDRERLAGRMTTLQQQVADMAKKFEDPERRLAFLEEQRRQDVRRVSEVQAELPELQKAVENIRPKIELLEDLGLRNERRILDVANSDRERRTQIQDFIDQQNLIIQQRDQQIAELADSFGKYDEDMTRYIERFETWSETYRQMKKIIDDFNRIAERLERRVNEVAEMQRLSEQRFQEEWNEFIADDQKRWKQFTLTNDEAWRSHYKSEGEQAEQIAALSERFPSIEDNIERLWKLERARADLYKERYQEMLMQYDLLASVPMSRVEPEDDNGFGGNGFGIE